MIPKYFCTVLLFFLLSACREPTLKETAFDGVTRASPRASLSQRLGTAIISDISTYDALTFDPSHAKYGLISYKLAHKARIRIRIVLRKQPIMVIRTLVDMDERPAGLNMEKWDGKDQSGNILDNFKCFFVIQADPPPHDKHPVEKCGDLKVNMYFLEHKTTRSNLLPVRVELLSKDLGFGNEAGYSVVFFVDGKVVHNGKFTNTSFPFFWELNTANLYRGEHMLTVNLSDLNDHIGTASRVFKISR